MTIQQILFLALFAVIIGSALFVVTTRNLFRGALMLIVSFFGVAGMYVLLEVGFFAVAQILVYIGAISILIIFGVMLTRGMQAMIPRNSQALGAAVVAAIIFGALLLILGPLGINLNGRTFGGIAWPFAQDANGNLTAVAGTYIGQFGISLVDVNQYVLPFLLISLLVDIALSGAVQIARQRRPFEVIADNDDIRAEAAEEQAEIEAARAAGVPALPETAVAHGHGSDH
jgi:NADH-quinone oxidoreductase subunit J